ncbi:MAG: glycosyltransferase [Pedosphaera sp.]|nr:glycosyltransferase [Pedosphaera sp.]MSU44171.1 glycosyltransferase [Pedosphaera sp.]
MAAPRLALLIPAYNEESRIGPVLARYAQACRAAWPGHVRITVVLNGCRDNTLAVVQQAAASWPEIEWLDFPAPIGKGGALIEGLQHALASGADIIGYVDADGATPPAAFLELARRCAEGEADCLIGSRWLPGSVLHRRQPRLRRFLSRGFHAIVQMLFWMSIQDTQCPAKVVRRAALEQVMTSLRIADLAFDVNLLYALHRVGTRIREVPVEWEDQAGSKVTASLGRSCLVMFLSVARLRLVYSPLYKWLAPLRPLETWLYLKLHAPPPHPRHVAEARSPVSPQDTRS